MKKLLFSTGLATLILSGVGLCTVVVSCAKKTTATTPYEFKSEPAFEVYTLPVDKSRAIARLYTKDEEMFNAVGINSAAELELALGNYATFNSPNLTIKAGLKNPAFQDVDVDVVHTFVIKKITLVNANMGGKSTAQTVQEVLDFLNQKFSASLELNKDITIVLNDDNTTATVTPVSSSQKVNNGNSITVSWTIVFNLNNFDEKEANFTVTSGPTLGASDILNFLKTITSNNQLTTDDFKFQDKEVTNSRGSVTIWASSDSNALSGQLNATYEIKRKSSEGDEA